MALSMSPVTLLFCLCLSLGCGLCCSLCPSPDRHSSRSLCLCSAAVILSSFAAVYCVTSMGAVAFPAPNAHASGGRRRVLVGVHKL